MHMDVKMQDMNLYPVLINLGLFFCMAAYMASALGYALAHVG